MRRNRQGAMLVRLAVLVALLAPLAAAGMLMAAVTATPLPRPDRPTATEFYDSTGALITRRFQENRLQVPLTQVPPVLRQAVLAAEDERFYLHRGIDLRGVGRALVRNLRARRVVEGGSTLTMQLARNLYLTHERTVWRKARELVYTLKLEAIYAKDEILEMYFNTIYLGQGAHGVEVAAQTYFGKHVQDLTLAEAALLAGLPRGPELYNPFTNPDGARARRNEVLDRMAAVGYITAPEAAAAQAEPLTLAPAPAAGGDAAFFLAYVEDQIKARHPEIYAHLLSGGYKIYTTLDPRAQQAAVQALHNGLPAAAADAAGVLQPQGALVAMDPRTGYLRALVGGRDFANSPYNRAVSARRQPGSAFKPFLYATLLQTRYYTAASTQMCEPVSFPGGAGRPPWRPKDFDPRHPFHNRPLGVREAIHHSDNVVAARWMEVIKPEQVAPLARSLGIDSPLHPDLTLALGSSEVSVLEMTRAFAAFANGGYRVEPLAILRILDSRGTVLVDNRPQATKALDERIGYILTDIMQGVLRPGGTAGQVSGLIRGRPAAGKTGTTEFSHDAWIVGYTPDLVAAVWAGNDDPTRPLPGNLTGATLSAPIWADFINRALAGQPHTAFRRPPGITSALVCSDSGLLATPACASHTELFLAGTEPTEYDPRWTPLPGAGAGAPEALPPEYPPGLLPAPPAEAPTQPPGEAPTQPPGETPADTPARAPAEPPFAPPPWLAPAPAPGPAPADAGPESPAFPDDSDDWLGGRT